ncbi:aminoglycoside phosphotransferase family protein [Gryllotalpicola reticulitermitis]|uniref:Aminoglycoside phosphotransferase family protein n=1 Tax=Gryllotalpicola reticulitermitis TaxID=1184153 RepID=A0ABV8Q3I3_9MICO
MHPHQIDVTTADVRRLLGQQFPEWAELPIEPVPSYGTTNAMFRVGDDMVARLPFIPGDGVDVRAEAATLERLHGRLPTAIPRVCAVGEPATPYPYSWSVLSWVPGEMPVPEHLRDPEGFVDDLVGFLERLRALATGAAPRAQRSGPLAPLAEPVAGAIDELGDDFDLPLLHALWHDALAAPAWHGSPVWVHADLLPSNLLVDEQGRLCGVLDWAAAGWGEPSCELLAAWNVFPAAAREVFRDRLDVDDAQWRRGRGWAVAQAALALPYYRNTNPGMVEMATRALRALEQESV